MSLTGYLLPFDQRSLWADFLRGGSEFGATTLSRFYAIHMLLLPAAIGAHLYLVTRLGITAPPGQKAEGDAGIRDERV